IHLARSQGEPADVYSHADSRTEGDSKVRSAHPGDQRGRIHRPHIRYRYYWRRAGYPTPRSTHRYPTAIVKGRKSPRRIIDPGPSPGGNPSPMAVAIGGPVHDRNVGEPHRAIVRVGAPATVVVEIFVAD